MIIPQWLIGVIVLAIYALVMLIIGALAYKKTAFNVKDYVTASSTMGIIVLLFTYSATYHSAYAFMGTVGFVYRDGVGWWMNGLWTVPPAIIFWIVGRRVWVLAKKKDYLSMGDFVGGLYDSKIMSILIGFVGMFFVLPYVAIQAQGVSYMFESISGGRITFEMGILFFIGIIGTYIFFGGVRGVAWTDVIQGIMMLVVILTGGVLVCMATFGGVLETYQAGAEAVPAMFTIPGPRGVITPGFWVSLWLVYGLGMNVYPHIFLRMIMGKSLRVMKWAAIGSAVFLTFIYVFVPAVGISAKMVLPDLAVTDRAFPMLLVEYTPFIFAAIAMAGAVAASMSTAGSQLHAAAAQGTRDVIDKLWPGKMDEKKEFNIARGLVLGFAVLSLGIALLKMTFVEALQIAAGGVCTLLPTVVIPLFWGKGNTKAALSSVVIGIIFLSILTWTPNISTPWNTVPGIWSMILAFIIYIGVSFFTGTNESIQKHRAFLEKVFW